jgi:hypothetical protein
VATAWMSEDANEINPEAFHRITNAMTCAEIQALLGEPLNHRQTGNALLPITLGLDSCWVIEKRLEADPERGHIRAGNRQEWLGERWGISVTFGDDGTQIRRFLWRRSTPANTY